MLLETISLSLIRVFAVARGLSRVISRRAEGFGANCVHTVGLAVSNSQNRREPRADSMQVDGVMIT